MHERDPAGTVGIRVRTEISFPVARAESRLLWISVEGIRFYSSTLQISHQIDARLECTRDNGGRPVLFGSFGIASKCGRGHCGVSLSAIVHGDKKVVRLTEMSRKP